MLGLMNLLSSETELLSVGVDLSIVTAWAKGWVWSGRVLQ